MRIMDLADELGATTVTVVAACRSLGIDATWAGAEISDADADRVRRAGPPSTVGASTAAIAGVPTLAPMRRVPSSVPPPPTLLSNAATPAQHRPAPPPVTSVVRRREQMVKGGWALWRRAATITAIMATFALVLAFRLIGSAVFLESIEPNRRSNTPPLLIVVLVSAAAVGYVTRMYVSAARNAYGGWEVITQSPTVWKGKGSIVFMVGCAVVSCLALATIVIGGLVMVVVRALG